jgi:hypothetical protein
VTTTSTTIKTVVDQDPNSTETPWIENQSKMAIENGKSKGNN